MFFFVLIFSSISFSIIIELENEIEEKEKTIEDMKKMFDSLKKSHSDIEYLLSNNDLTNNSYNKGLFYRIQLGAREIKHGGFNFSESNKLMGDDLIREGNFDKIRFGYYKTYNEAKAVEFIIRKSGNKNTWIIPFLDGNKITVKEALEIEKSIR